MNKRIPPPIITFICILGVYISQSVFPTYTCNACNIISFVLLFSGLSIVILSFYSFKKQKTTINPLNLKKSSSLVTCGLYKYTRNPMYLGMLLIILAASFSYNLYGGIFFSVIFVVFITTFQIIPEEKALKNMFGKLYIQYKNTTRRWL